MHDEIKLYNTKTKSLETFTPLKPGHVGIYSCGPTVYHYQHLGNMRAAVFADTLRRMFISSGFDVTHVINITDVGHIVDDQDSGEDKMEKGGRREGKTVWDIAKQYTQAYFDDLTLLNIPLDAYNFPRATETIQDQITLVQTLEKKGYTYRIIDDGIYFDTSKFRDYGDFAHLDIEGLKSGARVEENTKKRNITDFALWKFSPKNEKRQMEWDSPWGVGFPGWHIECSAMSMKYLGEHFDVHTGGIEHIPVHHTNEIAQSTCATGKPYVNYWMHNNHLLDTTGKMSKSNDSFLTVTSIQKEGYDPMAYRYFLLTAHYRKELQFSYEALDGASIAYHKLVDYCLNHKTPHGHVNASYIHQAHHALTQDLATPEVIATLWKLMKDQEILEVDRYTTLIALSDMLGLGLERVIREEIVVPEEVKTLLEEREHARNQKDYMLADDLRREIESHGFTVKDTSKGQEVRKQ